MNGSLSLSSLQGSSREALRQSLIGILGPEGETRQAAEERIQALEIMEQYGIHLIEFVLDPNYEHGVRELASEKLRHYIATHWDSSGTNFQPPETSLESKKKIKELVPLGLNDSNNKVREAIAQSISVIAAWDWPENWPEFLNIIVSWLKGDNCSSSQGALLVLSELTDEDLTETQVRSGGLAILEEMYKIFERKDQYSIDERNQAVNIITKMVSHLTMLQKPYLIEGQLRPVMPKFCKQFIEVLRGEDDLKNHKTLKMNIIKVIQILVTRVPKCISEYLPQILPLIWDIFIEIARNYQENIVNCANNADGVIDSDAIVVLEFLAELITMPRGYEMEIPDYNLSDYHWFYLLDNYIPPEALYCLINLMQITKKQMKTWTDNANIFISDEELKCDRENIDNVRIGAENFLTAIINHPERAAANSLIVGILKQLEAENMMRANGNPREDENWWKSHEAFLLAFCHAREIIINKQKSGTLHFDIPAFLENVVLADLNDPDSHPLLVGRCLCLSGIYADQIPLETVPRFLETTIKVLEDNRVSLQRLCAVKASTYWYDPDHSIRGNIQTEKILKSHLPAVYQGLHNLGSQLLSKEIVYLVLRSVANLVSLDKEFTCSIESKICPLTADAFLKFHQDYWVCSPSKDIFKELTLNPSCIGPLQTCLVPTLIRLMTDADSMHKNKEAAFDALQTLVEHSPLPLSSLLIEKAFPACCTSMLTISTDEIWALFSGAKVIHQYLSEAAEQTIDYRDESGKTGSQYILEAAAHLLDSHSKFAVINKACEIVKLLTKKAGNKLGDDVDKKLLTVLLSQMRNTEIKPWGQPIVLTVFAHLLNTKFDTVLKFLSTAPEHASQSALALVMSDGFCKKHELFTSNEDLRTVTLALSKVLEHGVTDQNSPLHKITIQDDQITSCTTSDGKTLQIMTKRSTPLLVKISKLITSYLSNSKKNETE